LRATLSSVARGSCYLGFARAFSGLWLGSSPDRWGGQVGILSEGSI
jgi:hypothetical protein